MKKSDLVSLLADKHKLPRNKTQELVEDLFAELAHALKRGELVDVRGFGTFRIRLSKARLGRNLHTGGTVPIPPRRVPSFRPGKELLTRCNSEQTGEDVSDEALQGTQPSTHLLRRGKLDSKTL